MFCKTVSAGLALFLLLGNQAKGSQYAFRVSFTNKNNTPYLISNPSAYLTSRSIARRTAQGIPIDSADIPVNKSYIDSVLSLTGGKLHGCSRWLNTCTILLEDSTQILNLNGKAFVSGFKLVGFYSTNLHRMVNYTGLPTEKGRLSAQRTSVDGAAYYGNTWTQTKLVNGNYLHDNGYKGQGMLIAVIDAGFIGTNTHAGFDSLRNDGRIKDTYNFNSRTEDVYVQDAHGTEVLSTISGYVPNEYVGSSPLASVALYLTENNGSEQPLELDNLLYASERADSIGADVITESLGYDLFDDPADGQDFATDLDGKTTVGAKAANMATKKGMLFVATAGNDGWPPVPGWGNHILTPGDADSALTIGAVMSTGVVAALSGYGPNAAGRVKPDVCGMGMSAATFYFSGGYTTLNGTSLSTPQIAGWAACLWQKFPTATPYQIRLAVVKCASSFTSPGEQIGYGVANFECTAQILDVRDTPLPFSPTNWLFAAPNPFDDEIKLFAAPSAEEDFNFQLFDMSGKLIFNEQKMLYKGYNPPVLFSVPELPVGLYLLKATSASQSVIIRLSRR